MSVAKEVFVFGPPSCGNRMIRRLCQLRNISCTIQHPHPRMHTTCPTANPDSETFVFRTYRDRAVWDKSWGHGEWDQDEFHKHADEWADSFGLPVFQWHYEFLVEHPVEMGQAVCRWIGEPTESTDLMALFNVGQVYDGNKKWRGELDEVDPGAAKVLADA